MHSLVREAVTWGPVALGGLIALLGLARAALRRAAPSRCPGPVRTWRDWFLPWRLLTGGCGYDLAGLPIVSGCHTCPECARMTPAAQRRPAWRRAAGPVLTGMAVSLSALWLPLALWVREGRWTNALSTDALLRVRAVLGTLSPDDVRTALEVRVTQVPGMSRTQQALAAEFFAEELKADDRRWNADSAMITLRRLDAGAAWPALERALDGPDHQQRHLAAHVLRQWPGYPPSPACLRVTVEGLRDDRLRAGDVVRNAREGLIYLTTHVDAASEWLALALASDDRQQRLLAAAAIGLGRAERLYPRAAPTLVEHLRHNATEEDSKFAVVALRAMGAPALPYLQDVMNGHDPQQRRLAALLGRRISNPGAPAANLARDDPAKITARAVDPTLLELADLEWYGAY